jgi:hypothetical protein
MEQAKHIKELEAEREWISVLDRLPNHPNYVIVRDVLNDVYPAHILDAIWRENSYNDRLREIVTHWMPLPLPEPPK